MGNSPPIRNHNMYNAQCEMNLKKFHSMRYLKNGKLPATLSDYNYSCVQCGPEKECKPLIPEWRPNMCVVSPLRFIDPDSSNIIDRDVHQKFQRCNDYYQNNTVDYCIEHIVHTGSDEMQHVKKGRKRGRRYNYDNRYRIEGLTEAHPCIRNFISQ